jgi:hypothetical protein
VLLAVIQVERLSRGAFDCGRRFEGLVIDFCRELFLIRCKRGRQSKKADEDHKRNFNGGFPLIRITNNLKHSSAVASFGGFAPSRCPGGGRSDQSPYPWSDRHFAEYAVLILSFYNGHGSYLSRCCSEANTNLFCYNFLKNFLTIIYSTLCVF